MKLIILTALLATSAYSATTTASYNEITTKRVTAARGMRMGTKLWVWKKGSSSSKGCAVWVNDACGRKMRGWGRNLDLSTGAFTHLFGSLRKGTGKVNYKILKEGRGRRIPR